MSSTRVVKAGPLVVKVWMNRRPSGESQVNLNCASPLCPHKCAMSFRTPPELWRVTAEEHAKRLCSLCAGLVKQVEEIKKQDGRLSPM